MEWWCLIGINLYMLLLIHGDDDEWWWWGLGKGGEKRVVFKCGKSMTLGLEYKYEGLCVV